MTVNVSGGQMLKRVLVLCALLVGTGTAQAASIQLIVNGDFETGTSAGWTINNTGGDNNFYIVPNDGGPLPASGVFGQGTQVNPGGGIFFAVADQSGPGGEELRQGFVLAAG